MNNYAKNPEYKKKLVEMRKLYDEQYKQMVNNALDYNDYQKYSILFDRHAKAIDKKPHLTGNYEEVLKQEALKRN
ncbi:hypothetical protein [Labilibaculum antarcticum]|uniref:Uncharacterized protein n=1 Tax=Labilibaculum antarcticum TaxID=1717717 RepID=A0A1Y1CL63_9BACT|nr:hypothetical protein [Labilibaculum antarcticum]BAX81126.1 hypothetical protein ALGA_2819 [Labilibaculum antarcticum]